LFDYDKPQIDSNSRRPQEMNELKKLQKKSLFEKVLKVSKVQRRRRKKREQKRKQRLLETTTEHFYNNSSLHHVI